MCVKNSGGAVMNRAGSLLLFGGLFFESDVCLRNVFTMHRM